jgi:hypothetical protein
MINQNARRTGAAGVIARALGTLGAATLLLTSTGWGALAGDTGFGAINLKAYQGAAAMTGTAPKGGKDSRSEIGRLRGILLESADRALNGNPPPSPMPPLVAPGGQAYSAFPPGTPSTPGSGTGDSQNRNTPPLSTSSPSSPTYSSELPSNELSNELEDAGDYNRGWVDQTSPMPPLVAPGGQAYSAFPPGTPSTPGSGTGDSQKSEPTPFRSPVSQSLSLYGVSNILDHAGTHNRGWANQPPSPVPPLVAPGGKAYSPYDR